MNLYQEAKAGLSSLVKQTAHVFIGLIVMLLLTGGNPPGFIVALSFCLGVGFVAWGEKKRLTVFDIEALLPKNLSPNKRAVLRRKIELILPTSASFQECQHIIQQVVEVETDKFLELVKIVGLNTHKDFAKANLSFANLKGVYLIGINLSFANLSHAILSGADLSRAILSDADLDSADLSHASLDRANLSRARLYKANLVKAYLNNVNLVEANLSGANLSGANLSGANLSRAKVIHTRFGDNLGIPESLKSDLIQRGAIFEDSPGDRDKVPTRI